MKEAVDWQQALHYSSSCTYQLYDVRLSQSTNIPARYNAARDFTQSLTLCVSFRMTFVSLQKWPAPSIATH